MEIKTDSVKASTPQIRARAESTNIKSEKSFADVLSSKQQATSAPKGVKSASPVEYTVKRGDSIWRISRQFNNLDPMKIAKDNNIANPDMIQPGQKLMIYESNAKPAQVKSQITKSAQLSPIESAMLSTPQPKAEKPKKVVEMNASWYGKEYHNKKTASGQRFDMHKDTLAHNTLPLGTKVRIVNPENGKIAEGVVNDRGPTIKGRDVDVSYALAKKLGFVSKGVTKLNVEILNPATRTFG